MQSIKNYQIESILGQNHNQGRITYKAVDIKNQTTVVIKQFLFATKNSQWSGYKSLEKEINILQKLDHPKIPKYIKHFDSKNGVCLVQEYIKADNCEIQKLSREEIYLIAVQILEILSYLEANNLVHKDIKPANILWDKKNHEAYLVDFGMSSYSHSSNASSTLSGTVVFMAPEQLFRGEISPQGDLYSLGASLYVLFSKIPSNQLSNQLDSRWQIPVASLKNQVPDPILDWLQTLLENDKKNRFSQAKIALAELRKAQSKQYIIQQVKSQPEGLILSEEQEATDIYVVLTMILIVVPSIFLAVSVFPIITALFLIAISIVGICLLYDIQSKPVRKSILKTAGYIVLFLFLVFRLILL